MHGGARPPRGAGGGEKELDPPRDQPTLPAAMPIYAYECTKCGQDAEYIQKFSDPPMETCERCGGPLRRQVTTAAFHLKGGGWYKDGYASSKPDAAKGDGGGAAGGSEAKSGGEKASGDKSSGDKATKSETATKPAKAATS